MRSPLFLFATGFAFIVAALGVWWYLQSGHGGNGIGNISSSLPFQGPSSLSSTPQNTAITSGAAAAGTVSRNEAAAAPAPQTAEQAHEEIEVRNSEPPLFEALPDSADDIDAYIQRALRGPLENGDAAQLITQDDVIDRSATVFVNLAKGQVVRNHLPITPVTGKFTVTATGNAEVFALDPANTQRYSVYVDTMEKFDTRKLATFYRTLSPALENAYRQLGEPGSFHDAMTTAFDLILATPEIDDAQITLVRPKVMYQYQSPNLEKLPPAQKLMLRMGKDNRTRVKKVIAQWRAQLKS